MISPCTTVQFFCSFTMLRIGDLRRGKGRGCDLIQQRLEDMVVALVVKNYPIRWTIGQMFRRLRPANPEPIMTTFGLWVDMSIMIFLFRFYTFASHLHRSTSGGEAATLDAIGNQINNPVVFHIAAMRG